jgi:hypothetical protein
MLRETAFRRDGYLNAAVGTSILAFVGFDVVRDLHANPRKVANR